ncbi:ABC-2 transporter permease [Xiamenia xianingshaonis]|uniref:ABC-2 transporter permease n=1 Tax=Xiamenia xianingshaonis TaxID=2682776 RepID=A0A9E6SUE6_9ACTN|nr:ABC-2 transporter permease [Xiamenia xianingshaonis]NHM13880.1 hypothetical protein [Xiamenia xianingshaonis]QTU84428.1 ABC-2 transporter permease [Xiamenia xianingshaonis]
MKTMLLADFITTRKYLVQQCALSAAIGLFVGIGNHSALLAANMLVVMLFVMLSISLLALDEQNGWQKFRLTLPLSRKHVVMGRYVSLLCAALLSLGVCLLTAAIMLGVGMAVPDVIVVDELVEGLSGAASLIVGSTVALCLVALLAMSLSLPFMFRFGMTKATRFLPALCLLLFCIAVMLSAQYAAEVEALLNALPTWVFGPAGLALFAVVALAVYTVSCVVSVKLYEKRDF